jgi:molybdopterin-guanine dinucleotide biosynthesis protein A
MDVFAGFVLTGGKSSRMGTDKAMLVYQGAPMVVHVADAVRQAAGSVRLIGPPELYGHLGFAATPDLRPGAGPLAGIETALSLQLADWNLVTACDMPALDASWLIRLLGHARSFPDADCILPVTPRGPEPLCAVYRNRALGPVRASLDAGIRKVTEALVRLHVVHFSVDNEKSMTNVNTPDEWSEVSGS